MAAPAPDPIVICSLVRTAIGAFNGSLKDTPATDSVPRRCGRRFGARGSIRPQSARW